MIKVIDTDVSEGMKPMMKIEVDMEAVMDELMMRNEVEVEMKLGGLVRAAVQKAMTKD